MEFYRKSADNGYGWGYVKLGMCYKNGTGVEKDYEKGMGLILKGIETLHRDAENGDRDSQYRLGFCYAIGIGVGPDKEKSDYWFDKHSKNGLTMFG